MPTENINIIVPVYNAEKCLKKCLNSLLNQSYKNISIILVDDGSTDSSGRICDEYSRKDRRISVIHKENGGVMSARNAGIEVIPETGYSTFCDADDYMPADGIQKLLELAIGENADVACGSLLRFFGGRFFLKANIPDILRNRECFGAESIKTDVLPSFFGITNFPGYMHTKLYTNELLRKSLDFECPVNFFQEDIAFNLQIALVAQRIAVMPDTVYYYRIGGGSSRFMPTFMEDCVSLYRFKMNTIKTNDLPSDFAFTTAVELKNECWTWLELYYNEFNGSKDKEKILLEISRCCNISEIEEAVNYPKDDVSGVQGFRELLKKNRIEEIYSLLKEHLERTKWKKMAKRILSHI